VQQKMPVTTLKNESVTGRKKNTAVDRGKTQPSWRNTSLN